MRAASKGKSDYQTDKYFLKLEDIRKNSGESDTAGLTNSEVFDFLSLDSSLKKAITQAHDYHLHLRETLGNAILMKAETSLIEHLQGGFVNFYAPATINPYVAISAQGPWIITSHGAVIHDNGGYGMLGSGHGPEEIVSSMSKNWVMANVMTASFSQQRFVEALNKELGHTRGSCPFDRYICVNSGSESVSVSLRIADVNSFAHTSPGGKHEGKEIKLLAIEHGFHGRTDRPAQLSHSCKDGYDKHLASFRDRDNLYLVPSNNIEALRDIFDHANKNNVHPFHNKYSTAHVILISA